MLLIIAGNCNINIMYKIYYKEGRSFFFFPNFVLELSVLSQLVKSYGKKFFPVRKL